MKSFSANYISEIESQQSERHLLFYFGFPSAVYYTDRDVNTYYSNNNYLAQDISISSIRHGQSLAVDSVDIEIQNVDRQFSAYLLGGDKRGKPVTVYGLAISGYTNYVEELFDGELDSWNLDQNKATLKCVSSWIRWNKKTQRDCTPKCPYKFKASKLGGSWSFDEGSGTTCYDRSGWDNDLTLTNATFDSTNEKVGYSLLFDNDNEYAESASVVKHSISGTKQFAVSLWVRPSTSCTGQTRRIVSCNDGTTNFFQIYVKSGREVGFDLGRGDSALETTTTLSTNTWYHLLCVFDGTETTNKKKIYIDGSLDTQGTSRLDKLYYTDTGKIYFGKQNTSDSYSFMGNIDEPRIYRKVPTTTQISNLSTYLDYNISGIYDGQCPYAGTETECDKSWTHCVKREMSLNYGGFRWIPYIEEKVITWGENWTIHMAGR